MIYEKSLQAPVFRRRRIGRELSLFAEKEGALTAKGTHFAAQGGSLVCAAGAELVSAPAEVNGLLNAQGHGDEIFYCFPNGVMLPGGELHRVYSIGRVFRFRTAEGETTFGFDGHGIWQLGEDNRRVCSRKGQCAAVCGERLFIADGCSVYWSAPLDPTDWERREQGAGSVDLPAEGGEIREMVPLGEDLYLFRDHGITRLRALGDALGFRAETVPYFCGVLQQNSVKRVGGEIVFAADGLYLFDGTRCKRLDGCGYREIAEGGFRGAAEYAGDYYAAVRLRSGEARLWCVSPAEGRGHFLGFRATAVAGGRELLFLEEGKLFRLAGRGLPRLGRRACTLDTEPSLLGLSGRPMLLDGVTVEGEGTFRVEARGERGLPRAVCGRANERLSFPVPVRGRAFSLHLCTSDPSVRIRRVLFDVREEVAQW